HLSFLHLNSSNPLHTEDRHKGSRSYGCTDYSGNVWSHGVHQQKVGRICFRSHFLGYTGCHRYSGYTGGTDQWVDLAVGQLAHQLAQEHASRSTEGEGYQ